MAHATEHDNDETARVDKQLKMTFDIPHNRIRIPYSTLVALGKPTYLAFAFKQGSNTALVIPTTPPDAARLWGNDAGYSLVSESIYKGHRAFVLRSEKLMKHIRKFLPWKYDAQYRVSGTIARGEMAVASEAGTVATVICARFDMTDWEAILRGKPLRVVK